VRNILDPDFRDAPIATRLGRPGPESGRDFQAFGGAEGTGTANPHPQNLRHRVIDAVQSAKLSRRALSSATPKQSKGFGKPDGPQQRDVHGGHRPPKPDVAPQALRGPSRP
jgi:hypothetical protein